MALVKYKKYQVLLNPDSKKVQGLQTGDIIRRQYFNGTDIIYSLLCVLSYGVERTKNTTTGLFDERPYFIGALLEGDELDGSNSTEIFDFARITNLFNVNRLGALYLTASDDYAPYMDVIDGIGKNKSLCWPEGLMSESFEDSQSQYIVRHSNNLNIQYTPSSNEVNRILTVTRMSDYADGFEGLQQDFYQFIQNNNQVLVSYKVRSSSALESLPVKLGYTDGLHVDAEWTESIGTEWEYKFQVVTVEYSGRHLRSLKIDLSGLPVGEEIQIADLNIILLSSVANFGDASTSRIGKLDGVTDHVFGQLTGYGAYIQKLYASQSAHISGTLTAGDENGFGATFYAGKIHKNCFVNSLDVNITHEIHIENDDSDVVNPTGIGCVYRSSSSIEMIAQTNQWLTNHVGKRFCFSFWTYFKKPGRLTIQQNDKAVGEITIASDQTHEWRRVHVFFDLLIGDNKESDLILKLSPTFTASIYESVDPSIPNPDSSIFYFTAPQLESGDKATQYQATDETLNETGEYGAWFNRGGIGGTMQNPLLQLNYKDEEGNEGGIGTRSKSFLLRQDGSGYLAKKNIVWDKDGKVTFNDGVTLNWDNLDKDAQDQLANRYCRILGDDTFTIIGQDKNAPVSPTSITLTLEEIGFTSTPNQRQWYYKKDGEFVEIEDANAKTLVVDPDSEMWGIETNGNGTVGGESYLTVMCEVKLNESRTYSDTFTIKKQYVQGYTVEVVSSTGTTFQNGTCSTVLTANVYYQGKLVDPEYAKSHYQFQWKRYSASNIEQEIEIVGGTIDEDSPNVLTLDYELNNSEIIVCELLSIDGFEYAFPITF